MSSGVQPEILKLSGESIATVDMHTSGEATRIIVKGYPTLQGSTLLEKRECARAKFDHIRRRLMQEPRGHSEMYGAILIHDTELTRLGDADMGVLFCHNEGYSTMCGHASIALGRYLVDSQTVELSDKVAQDQTDETGIATVRLHAPCGLVQIKVPVVRTTNQGTGKKNWRSDNTRNVSFLGVPSYATAIGVIVGIPEELRWAALRERGRSSVNVDVAYGGAFYALVASEELGFPGSRAQYQLQDFDDATSVVKAVMKGGRYRDVFSHPSEPDLEYLYGVIVKTGTGNEGTETDRNTEVGLCFFADRQLDRSPTGSGVCARIATEVAKGTMEIGASKVYHSLVSDGTDGGFKGTAVEKAQIHEWRGDVHKNGTAVVVRVEGKAYYTGTSTFWVEQGDPLQNGFKVQEME